MKKNKLILVFIFLFFIVGCSNEARKDKNMSISTGHVSKVENATSFDKNVIITDKNLENVIRKAINKSQGILYLKELSKITELDGSGQHIKDLNGIENLTNLKELNLSDNEISDITPLKDLVNLSNLSLVNDKIKDLDDLSALTNLEKLSIGNFRHGRIYTNTFTNLIPLKNLTNLKDLNLACSNVKLNGLRYLTSLENLNLYFNFELEDISELSNLANLRVLNISYTNVQNIEPLTGLTKLTDLDIGNSKVTDIHVLYKFAQLKKLTAWNVIKDKDYDSLIKALPDCEIIYN